MVNNVSKKKINPRRKPATMADVKRAKAEVAGSSVTLVMAVGFTVLHDKEGYGERRLRRVLREVYSLIEGISGGHVSVNDLLKTLKEETGINLMRDGGG